MVTDKVWLLEQERKEGISLMPTACCAATAISIDDYLTVLGGYVGYGIILMLWRSMKQIHYR